MDGASKLPSISESLTAKRSVWRLSASSQHTSNLQEGKAVLGCIPASSRASSAAGSSGAKLRFPLRKPPALCLAHTMAAALRDHTSGIGRARRSPQPRLHGLYPPSAVLSARATITSARCAGCAQLLAQRAAEQSRAAQRIQAAQPARRRLLQLRCCQSAGFILPHMGQGVSVETI